MLSSINTPIHLELITASFAGILHNNMHSACALTEWFYYFSTYEESLKCIEENSMECTQTFKEHGIKVATEYMNAIVKEKCEQNICF